MNTQTQTLQDERSKIDQRITAAEKVQSELAQLQRSLEFAQDALLTAESRRAFAEARIAELKAMTLDLWAKPDTKFVSNTNTIVECWATINTLTAVLSDWPRAKSHLISRLKAAETELATFQRTANR